ncbi:hypothetical protein DERP_011593 [Dermatophagoides pteronyssinus]|uniref:Adaptor-related protein complex 5 beta subunit n=1 Tax=Dermatophagoides pteronyssinus TaxID=6956 RepID=A0ABQ8JWC4_DERPT|nr:hypothetical protein DERP_011593 [Dermatophagoides pteronyssinus]
MASILNRLNPKIDIKSKQQQQHHQQHQQSNQLLLNPRSNDWFDRFIEISTQLCFDDFNPKWLIDIHANIIHDLYDDSIGVEIHLHLLSLLEQMFPLFDCQEKVAETFQTLLSLIERNYKSRQRTIIIPRLYYCATSLLLFFKDSVIDSDHISKLFSNFLRTLLTKTNTDQQSFEYDTCLDCLREISSTFPEMFNVEISNDFKLLQRAPKNLQEAYFMLPLFDLENNLDKIRNLIQQFDDYISDIKFYHICMDVHHLILSGKYNTDKLSLLILRPFLSKFIISNQIHQIQFALKLLIEFGFDIYSSREEELFLRQMVQASTIPSIPVGHRLLLLAFIRIAFESIYEPPLNSPPLSLLNSLYPLLFDGPDTQEKKLQILNQSTFIISDDEFFNLFYRFYRQCSTDKRNYIRASNGLFHLMNQSIRKRTQLTDRLLQLLLDSFFNTQYLHYIRKFSLFCRDHKELGQKLVDNFIAKLMMMTKDQDNNCKMESLKNLPITITSFKVYIVYLEFIDWFLSVAHRHIRLTEFQTEFLINFIHRNSFHYTDSSTMALQCCTSILYYQRVTQKVKGALFSLLEWLRNERKSDLEASSLAQIYLLALRTLTEESIKQVFTSDEEEFLLYQTPEIFEQYLLNVKNTLQQCPIQIERSKINIVRQKYCQPPFSKIISFDLSLDQHSRFNRIFAIEIRFKCKQNNSFEKLIQIPCLDDKQKPIRIDLPIDFLINDTIQLIIEVKFVDIRGNIYDHHQNQIEPISFEDLLISFEQINIDQIKTNKQWTEHLDLIQTIIICLPDYHTIQSFIDHHQWLESFIINDDSIQNSTLLFVIGTTPDRLVIGSIKLINQCINIELETNHYGIMPALFSRFRK